jgi:hypothetical protein
MSTRAVLLQQGRPLLDSDVNEQAGLVADRSEAITRHVVGLRGVPRDDAGFAIRAAPGGFTIGAGALYADGLPLHNASVVSYAEQLPVGVLPTLVPFVPDGSEALVYVEAVLRPALDPALSEPSLAGVDTVVRELASWAVRVAPLAGIGMTRASLIQALERNQPVNIVPWPRTSGGLDAGTDPASPDDGPCEIAATAGYVDQLNRLYRVEIHEAGAAGVATFKWTEDASREAGLRAADGGFVIDLPRAQLGLWFAPGAVVELIDEPRARAGLPGAIGTIGSELDGPLVIAGVNASLLTATTRIRRWAATPAVVPSGAVWAALDKGVRVRFASGHYALGSAWTIPARTVLGDVSWPPYTPADKTELVGGAAVGFIAPLEGLRYYAALALIRRSGASFSVTQDLRSQFPPLTDITARDVRFDDSSAELDAVDVQQAIDALARRRDGCCTWTAGPSTDLQALVDSIPARGNGKLCLSAGNYALKRPLLIRGKGHIQVSGVGPGTKLWCRGAVQTLVIDDCSSVEVTDLLIAAEAASMPEKIGRTGGALDIANSGPVRVQRATLLVQGRKWKQAAALRIACSAVDGGGDVTIEDCDLVAGDLACGIIVLAPRVARIANSRIRPRLEPSAKTLLRWQEDKTIAAAFGRLAFSHAIDNPDTRVAPVTRRDVRVFRGDVIAIHNVSIHYYARDLVSSDAIGQLAKALAVVMRNGDSRRYRLRLRRLSALILPKIGRLRIGDDVFDGFAPFYTQAASAIAPIIDTGIVIGGGRAQDVTIEGNRIEGACQGIRVGVGAGTLRERLPLGTTRIVKNHVRLRVAPVDIVRMGIYLGNAVRAWIIDNDIALESDEPSFTGPRAIAVARGRWHLLHAEGVRVFGVLGPVLYIQDNGIRGCPASVTVTGAQGTVTGTVQWLVRGNYVAGPSANYRLERRCKNIDNV